MCLCCWFGVYRFIFSPNLFKRYQFPRYCKLLAFQQVNNWQACGLFKALRRTLILFFFFSFFDYLPHVCIRPNPFEICKLRFWNQQSLTFAFSLFNFSVLFTFSHLSFMYTLQRQAADGGFQGRPNKPSDTCYAFWYVDEYLVGFWNSWNIEYLEFCNLTRNICLYRIASILKILGGHKLIDQKALRGFLITCQSEVLCFSFSHTNLWWWNNAHFL